jgi:hypothetical protein
MSLESIIFGAFSFQCHHNLLCMLVRGAADAVFHFDKNEAATKAKGGYSWASWARSAA